MDSEALNALYTFRIGACKLEAQEEDYVNMNMLNSNGIPAAARKGFMTLSLAAAIGMCPSAVAATCT